jgi:16S rRNA processing protein RimM
MSAPTPERAKDRVCVGQFAGAQGVRGLAKLRSFCGVAADALTYGPLFSEDGLRRFVVTGAGEAKGNLIVKVEGVLDRDQAQALNGLRLYVDRDRLSACEEDEFLHADLIGLDAVNADGQPMGRVRAVHDFGGGDILEIERPGGAESILAPFTKAIVPDVNLAARRVTVDLPEDWMAA